MAPSPGIKAERSLPENWTDDCHHSFETFKTKLIFITGVSLRFSLPFILELDASLGGLGAVLSQEPNGRSDQQPMLIEV